MREIFNFLCCTAAAAFICLGCLSSANALGVVVAYSIDDDAGLTASTLGSGVVASDLSSPTWKLNIALNDLINVTENNGLATGTDNNIVDAFLNGQFVEFSISTSSPFTLDDLVLTRGRAANGPQDLGLRVSTDGFAGGNGDTGLAAFDLFFDQALLVGDALQTIDLSPLVFDATTDYTFRIAADDRVSNGQTSSAFRLSDVTVNGTPVAVPEASSLVMFGLGIFSLVARRRKQLNI